MRLWISILGCVFLLAITAQGQSSICKPYALIDEGAHHKLNPPVPQFESTAIWQVSSPKAPNKVSYLVGTLHTDDRDIVAQRRRLIPLLSKVQGYYSEVRHSPGENISALIASEKPVEQYLDADFLELYKARLKQNGLPYESMNQLNLWYNVFLLSAPKTSKFSLDQMLLTSAIALGQYSGGFETNPDVAKRLESLGEDNLSMILKEVLCSSETIDSQNKRQLVAYGNNAIGEAYEESHKYHSTDPTLYQRFMEAIVFDRNDLITERLVKEIPRKAILAAFGYAHLMGEKGVLYQLKQKGFNVAPVSFAQLDEMNQEQSKQATQFLIEKYLPLFNRFLTERGAYAVPEEATEFPEVVYVLQKELQDIACYGTPCPIYGLYDSEVMRLTYSLVPAVMLEKYEQVGIVFHEYVHFVQERYGDHQEVDQQDSVQWALREREAKLLQYQFVQWMRNGSTVMF